MKQRIIWLPTLVVLICSTMLTGCVSLDIFSDDFLKDAGITVGVLAVAGIISLFDKDDSKKSSNDKKQVEKANHTISLNNHNKEIEDINFSSKKINTIKLTGTYTEDSFKSFVYSIRNVKKVALDLSKIKNMEEVPARVFVGKENLVKIYLPETIEKINSEAFYDCKNLVSIEFPKSVKSIDADAFRSCKSLETIKFNSNISVISNRAFSECTAIKEIVIPDSVTEFGREVFSDCASLEKVKLPNKITQLSSSLFRNCSSLVSVNIPNSVTEIQSSVFNNCVSLKEISIPSSVKQVGWYAFENCSNLTSIKFDGCVEFSRDAFKNCKKLKLVQLPANLKEINSYLAFNVENVSKDFKFVIDSSNSYFSVSGDGKILTSKDGKTLYVWACATGDISIPEGITVIGDRLFSNNKNITSVIISDSVEIVSYNTFEGCSNLKSIVFPEKLLGNDYDEYGDESNLNKLSLSLSECENLQSVVLPKNISFVDFSGCVGLEKITLPSNCNQVNFNNCTNLKSLEFENGVKNLGFTFDAFKGCSNLELIKFPNSLEFIGFKNEKHPVCFPTLCDSPKLKFQVDKDNKYFSTADNGKMLTSKDGKTLYSWAGLSGDVTIPKNISIIENSSSIIEGYDIKTLTIPEHVEFLGGYSFSDGNIEKLIINSKEIKLAERVFYNCKNLKSVVINGNLSNKYFAGLGWRGDGYSVFSDCKNLESFEFYGKIINHDNTRSESFSTWFYKCEKLNNVILSNRIISLDNPFEGCQSLKEINFLGTKSEWNKIEIDMESDTILQNAKINFLPKR